MEGVRLHKVIAQAGVASRRKAEALIAAGRVRVNGHTVAALGAMVDPQADAIVVDGRPPVHASRAALPLAPQTQGLRLDV